LKLLLVYFFIIPLLVLSTCKKVNKIPNGRYTLSHAQLINDENVILPMPEDVLIVINDSIYYNGFESYIKTKCGIIKNEHIIFENGDQFLYSFSDSVLNTYDDSLNYIWFIRK